MNSKKDNNIVLKRMESDLIKIGLLGRGYSTALSMQGHRFESGIDRNVKIK